MRQKIKIRKYKRPREKEDFSRLYNCPTLEGVTRSVNYDPNFWPGISWRNLSGDLIELPRIACPPPNLIREWMEFKRSYFKVYEEFRKPRKRESHAGACSG
jgi:hypothetical protein